MKRRITAVMLMLSITMSMLSVCLAAEDQSAEASALAVEQAVEETQDGEKHSDSSGKETTVYVIADADGKREKTIVSSWLKNQDGAATLSDRSSLSGIENVKGDETYTENEDGSITWQAQGNDIYYQGTSDEKLPIDVSISYLLDGKKVRAEQLSGATGHLTVTFRYKNNTAANRTIDGENCMIYKPYVVVSGMLLDNDKAHNIKVENGEVISSGDQSVVVGMAMPGLKQSLGLNDSEYADEIDIPENVVIEADVKDFSLLMTITMASDNALSRLGLDDIDSVDELSDKMDELSDASRQLVDGSTELADGADSLYEGTESLQSGVGDLSDGAGALDSGAAELKDGTADLKKGVGALSNGISDLKDGTAAAKSGTAALKDGTSGLKSGASDLKNGTASLSAGANGVKDGAGELDEGVGQLQTQIADLPAGTERLLTGMKQVKAALKGSDNSIYAAAAGIKDGAETIAAKLREQIAAGAESIKSGAQSISEGAEALSGSVGTISDGIGNVQENINTGKNYADQAKSALSGIRLDENDPNYAQNKQLLDAAMQA
ncbi:MAG: hypothetical protein ACI4PQ_00175, partial [Butyricicoccaceae bacterium]